MPATIGTVSDSERRAAVEAPRCYRHPGRETLLSCSSCGRPICPSCATHAAVGQRCPECAGGRTGLRRATPPPGGLAAHIGAPVATYGLIVANVLVFLVELGQGITLSGTGTSALVANWGLRGPQVADGDWWRILTSSFVHAGLLHIAFNMLALWWLGSVLERDIGSVRFLAIYFSAVLWGAAGALLLDPNSLTVGASGGVFGVMAGLLVLERQRGIALLGSSVGGLLLINLVITFVVGGISIGGHLGGILGGALAALALSEVGRHHLSAGPLRPVGTIAVAGVLAAGAVAALAVA